MTMRKVDSGENKTTVKTTPSVSDVMSENANEVIMKIESLMPRYIESITNFQAEYLRIARDFFGTCYLVEYQLRDKIGVNEKAVEAFDKYLKVLTKSTNFEIDLIYNLQRTFVDNTITFMKTYDEYFRLMLSRYAKMLEYTSAIIPKRT
jgi:tetratricopeptide (TPR) repeat protein